MTHLFCSAKIADLFSLVYSHRLKVQGKRYSLQSAHLSQVSAVKEFCFLHYVCKYSCLSSDLKVHIVVHMEHYYQKEIIKVIKQKGIVDKHKITSSKAMKKNDDSGRRSCGV